ncbi:hypothetical protein TSACC_2727 [Terrimicrobium sacchariphilum]|uniref:Uncharacterized protein n=1 Tax=Terrimicrobium sacchariphilum TaxID=690879 RepID=A0A146G3C3_TERSA|nr:hypothetical protein [Terrimicrobium sacchariphilum]GAT32329.1 hypothetical protein TSACC_2727 [Terrimicrobium sacchariphilum]
MNAHDLARAAETANKSARHYTPMEPYIPAVDVLRRKGWSWEAIHTWLRSQGQRVQKSPTTFAACMGRCYRRWISRETARLAAKVGDASLPGKCESPGNVPLNESPPPRRKKGGKVNTPNTAPATPTELLPAESQS